jgi:predicted Zn-dependent peptidase
MLNRQIAPPFYRSTQLNLLQPDKIISSSGAPLYVMQGGEQDVIRIEWVFNAGKVAETKIGQSHFTAQQLDKGTSNLTSLSLAEGFEKYGAHIDVSAGNDYTTLTLYTLSKHLHQVLPLLEEIIHQVIFPEDELMLAQSIAQQQYQINKEKTSFLAGKYFRSALFGNHPYANEIEDSHIKEITREDLLSFYHTAYQLHAVFICGKMKEDAIKAIEKLTAGLKYQPQNIKVNTIAWPKPKHEHIQKDGSVQTTIRFGKLAINRNHPDFISLLFTTHILGGYFGSRLMKNIREDKGLTYGIYSVLQPLQQQAILSIGADVNQQNKELTLSEIKKEINKLKTELVEKEEFENARNYFVGSLQSEVSTIFANSDKIKTIILNNLPVDYYQQMIDTIENMKPEDVAQTATSYFDLESFTTITVG